MIRLVLLLGAGLFTAMLIGGEDRGQLRFGLIAAKDTAAAALVADQQADMAAEEAAVSTLEIPAPTVVEEVSFAPAQPVMAAVPAETETAQVLPQPTALAPKILFVSAKSVNVREGPGKDFGVVSRLARGEAVLVVSAGEGPDGWSLIRIEGDGVEGYVASRLLSE